VTEILAKGADKSGVAAATGTADARRTAHETGAAPKAKAAKAEKAEAAADAAEAPAKPKRAAKAAAAKE
jgi:large subunit ribosomal protein L21